VTPVEASRFESASLGRLAISLRPGDPAGAIFMILTAYYDESGTHGDSPLTVLAGFVGHANDWVDFEREWRKILKKHNITHVRAKNLFHRQGPHKHWTEKQVYECFVDLLYVIQERRRIFASKTVLSEDDYKRFYVLDGCARRERLDTRYALCLRSLLHFYPQSHYCHDGSGIVNFILEAGHRNAGDALRVFNEIKEDKELPWREAVGSLTFGKKEDYPALQASDMLAYWFYKTQRRHRAGNYVSFFESELHKSRFTILENVISLNYLTNMRKNFLRKRKKVIFKKAMLDNTQAEIEPDSIYVPHMLHN
jgi:Protein of unknown function (DUF3800)